MTLELVDLEPAHLGSLLAMAQAFHAEDHHALGPHGEAALRALCDGEPMARGWLAREGGEVVGYAVLTFGFSIEHGGRDGFIDDFYLVPVARGQGLGRMLLEAVIAQSKANGVRVLHLEVEPDNRRAENLYRRHGFADTGRRLMSLCLSD